MIHMACGLLEVKGVDSGLDPGKAGGVGHAWGKTGTGALARYQGRVGEGQVSRRAA